MNAGRHAGMALLAVTLGLGACVASAAEVTQPTRAVDIRNFTFAPSTLTVPAGTRVVWTNRDDEPHLITSAGGQFEPSHALDTSDSYAVTFSKPGTYAYYCSIHPMMVGTIIVQ
jgi:plastocyanin